MEPTEAERLFNKDQMNLSEIRWVISEINYQQYKEKEAVCSLERYRNYVRKQIEIAEEKFLEAERKFKERQDYLYNQLEGKEGKLNQLKSKVHSSINKKLVRIDSISENIETERGKELLRNLLLENQ